ncbi:hypothetical protein K466DRAFT_256347 [Polyporus arcularius HHB13444]|uniref:Uncharacterized protein n=1 Tax=Polyporus arcularius HHB13444 TaxID=1314778 RepID=A0A5C3PR82_9APHY|nr:hypothetical protein K466DRAFT_256347 [Polyporus arcularius HHB13444]
MRMAAKIALQPPALSGRRRTVLVHATFRRGTRPHWRRQCQRLANHPSPRQRTRGRPILRGQRSRASVRHMPEGFGLSRTGHPQHLRTCAICHHRGCPSLFSNAAAHRGGFQPYERCPSQPGSRPLTSNEGGGGVQYWQHPSPRARLPTEQHLDSAPLVPRPVNATREIVCAHCALRARPAWHSSASRLTAASKNPRRIQLQFGLPRIVRFPGSEEARPPEDPSICQPLYVRRREVCDWAPGRAEELRRPRGGLTVPALSGAALW